VHLGLPACALAALGTLQLLHIRNAIHADVGLAFAGLVSVYLAHRKACVRYSSSEKCLRLVTDRILDEPHLFQPKGTFISNE
jgi:hypothetical protein